MKVLLRYETDSGRAVAEAQVDLGAGVEATELDQVRRLLDRATEQLIRLIAKDRANQKPDHRPRQNGQLTREHQF